MPLPDVEVRVADSAELKTAAMELRRKVFCEEQGFSVGIEQDGEDDKAEHLIAVSGGKVVGCARIRYFQEYAKFERIAVSKEQRGSGIGGKLLNYMIEHCRRIGIKMAKLSAQTHSLGFYRRNGFQNEGVEFDVEGVGHQMMVRSI